ncbi:uncharacterized protein LOC144657057 [Oculina patagonica]
MMPWCEDRGPRKNGVSDVRGLNLSESVGEHKWICWSSTVAMNYTCVFKRRRRGLSKELSDVPVCRLTISKDLNLNTILKRRQSLY